MATKPGSGGCSASAAASAAAQAPSKGRKASIGSQGAVMSGANRVKSRTLFFTFFLAGSIRHHGTGKLHAASAPMILPFAEFAPVGLGGGSVRGRRRRRGGSAVPALPRAAHLRHPPRRAGGEAVQPRRQCAGAPPAHLADAPCLKGSATANEVSLLHIAHRTVDLKELLARLRLDGTGPLGLVHVGQVVPWVEWPRRLPVPELVQIR